MAKATIVDLARRRQYSELEKQADELIRREDWGHFLQQLKLVRPDGKARDAVIALLQLGLTQMFSLSFPLLKGKPSGK